MARELSEEERQGAMKRMKLSLEAEWKSVPASDSYELLGVRCMGALGCFLGRVTASDAGGRWRMLSVIASGVRQVGDGEERTRVRCVECGSCEGCPLKP